MADIREIQIYCSHDAVIPYTELKPNPKNPNRHPGDQVELLAKIIEAQGWRQPVKVSTRSGLIVSGHGRYEAAKYLGCMVPVDYQEYATDEDELADLLADNRIAEMAEMDTEMLRDIFAEIDLDNFAIETTGYTENDVAEITTALNESLSNEFDNADDVPEVAEQIISQRGDLWILGRHRLVCGDSTNDKHRALLLNGEQPEILLIDPPYCSGGFQETSRSSGSIGTAARDSNGERKTIANDTLSTRGYQQLMRSILKNFDGTVVYCFTDWRMWIYLYDVMEESGFGVKSMIVWNKKTPGMGQGWRAQHELIMFAHRTKPKWNHHKGYGNVLEVTRSGNALHPTQKPVELLEQILDNTEWGEGVLDTFGGSGTTLIAAESMNQPAYLIELEPSFVDVIVKRYIKTTGSYDIKLIRDGQEIAREHYEILFD